MSVYHLINFCIFAETIFKAQTKKAPVLNWSDKSCPSLKQLFDSNDSRDAIRLFRDSVLTMNKNQNSCEKKDLAAPDPNHNSRQMPLHASEFVAGNKEHMEILGRMGIRLTTMADGRVQLVHKTTFATTLEDAETGILFMTEMLELSKQQEFQIRSVEYYSPNIKIFFSPFFNSMLIKSNSLLK